MMSEVKNPSVFPVGEPLPEMFSKYFIGQAYLQPLTQLGGPIANVTFEPGCYFYYGRTVFDMGASS